MTEHFAVERDLVVVQGPDATSFLQSLVSQDLDPIEVGESAHSLMLQPQGKLLVEFRVHRHGPDEWWCVCEPGFGAVLAEGLNRFKIRVKAEIEPRSVSAAVSFVEGAEHVLFDSAIAPHADPDQYERARIEAGVPRMGADIDDRTIPQEAFLDRDAVSFTKGCFVGQELVCRIDTRGHVNRSLRRLRGASLDVGTEVVVGDKVVGTVTSSVGDVALAMLRREVEPGATVMVDEQAAHVEAV
jgi:folate-binding protein YgfZ